ncbi:MAG: streptogramin lyase [Cyanobacteria bacterium RYN_339]|nr:streptogramin lyase [Cyanobacteria bacterium RYN_339]
MLRRRLPLVVLVALGVGCTRLKDVPATTASVTPASSSTPDAEASVAAVSSPSPTPVPATPTPAPTPAILLIAPGNAQDFAADSIDITFQVTAPEGRKITDASVQYDGSVIGSITGAGPVFKVPGWNPNVVNNLQEPPDTATVPAGDHTITILAKDDKEAVGKLEFNFRKPLRIQGWQELTAMPGVTSHFAIFGDGAQPPAFMSLWGSVDGFENVVIPRTQTYAFTPGGQGAWTEIKINGSSVPRAGYGTALHPSGQLAYLIGGRTGNQDLRTLEVFSPLRKVAEQALSAMTNARRDAAAVYTSDNFVYAIGGTSGATPIYSVERVEMATDGNPKGDWKARSDTQNARSGANAVQQGNEIWLFGGGFRPIEAYDPATDQWKFLVGADGNVVGTPETWSHSLMVKVQDRLYFFGGEREDGSPVKNIYEFTPATKRWRTIGPLPSSDTIPNAEIGATRLGGFFLGDSFYLMGGISIPERLVTKRVFKGLTL